MRISVPTEVKNNEYRVALTPAGVHDLVSAGHEVFVQRGAGEGSSMPDAEYAAAGATLLDDAAEVWERAELLLKVKEPIASEYGYFRDDLVIFTYLHLAADRPLTERLVADRVTAIAYETVQAAGGGLPLLAPMSEVAGRLAPTVGRGDAHALRRRPRTADVGRAGHAPGDGHRDRRRRGRGERRGDRRGPRRGCHRVRHQRAAPALSRRPLPGPRQDRGIQSPAIWTAQSWLRTSSSGRSSFPGRRRPSSSPTTWCAGCDRGRVLVDIAVDQGGCFEDTHPTTHADPTFPVHGSVFYCVANMPGAVPNTSTSALTNATLPYIRQIARRGWKDALRADAALAAGLNTVDGTVVNPGVATAHGLELAALAPALG